MKVVQINTFSNKSTGTIMMSIHKELLKLGHESYVAWARGRKSNNKNEILIGNKLDVYFHGIMTRLTDKVGFYSKRATKRFIRKLEEIKPDIVHLHNIHGYYINIELLFNYLKEKNIKVVWTLHDCWPFTGHCAYFSFINCNKWKTQCNNCPQINKYPKSFTDNSKWNYEKKKELFTNINMTIITPSNWLANITKKSFMGNNKVIVINNGVDCDIFKQRKSNFRKKYNLENKTIILGVASTWEERKGLQEFIKLSEKLDNSYKIVLVGLSNKQLKIIPKNILGLKKTNTAEELAEIYSNADIFFNPTLEDNYPTTNLEAIACGTPVITYNTGGSPEIINNTKFGSVVNNIDEVLSVLDKKYTLNFDRKILSKSNMCSKYIKEYENILDEKNVIIMDKE